MVRPHCHEHATRVAPGDGRPATRHVHQDSVTRNGIFGSLQETIGSGAASGINNAVSRIAGLLAIALLGLALISVFNRDLDRRLDRLSVSPELRQQIDSHRSMLAGIPTDDAQAQKAIAESFIAGYRTILGFAVALSIAGSLSALLFIGSRRNR